MVAGANLMLPLARGDRGFWKLGAKYRAKDKFRDNRLDEVEADDDLFLEDFIDPSFDGGSIIDGRYDMGPFQGRSQVDRILGRDDLETRAGPRGGAGRLRRRGGHPGRLRHGAGGSRFPAALPRRRPLREHRRSSTRANELVFDEEGDT